MSSSTASSPPSAPDPEVDPAAADPSGGGLAHADARAAGHRLHVDRFAVLVDGVDYYPALRAALLQARREVWVLGWDVHSEIDLVRGDAAERVRADDDDAPIRFADLLEHVVEQHPDLQVRLLIWSGSALFAGERQYLPRMKRPWAHHPRIRLEWDRRVPPLGSQHQKFVVIDDRIAFVGGMDLTTSRWDSHEHRLHDRRRRAPGLLPHFADPYHEVMAAVDDEAASALGAIARDRWRRATGESLPPAAADGTTTEEDASPDPWPAHLEPMFRDHRVTLARTDPGDEDRSPRREVETAWRQQVAEAQRLLFIETQYLNAEIVVAAMAARLAEPDGPEIILVLPWGCPGRIQAMGLDPHRDRMLDRLREADRHGRFGVYWATRDGEEPDDPHTRSVYIHAKLLIVDDALLRIGSANLNGRSMGLDTEADIFIQVSEEADRARLAALRHHLIGNLLRCGAEDVAAAERDAAGDPARRHAPVFAAIESLRGGRETLVPFTHRAPEDIAASALPIGLADPDRPMTVEDARRVVKRMRAERRFRAWLDRLWNALVGVVRRSPGRTLLVAAVGLAIVLLLVSPAGDAIDPDAVMGTLERIGSSPWGAPGVFLGFTVLATAGAPVTALILATGAALGGVVGVPVALAGVIAAAAAGRFFGGLMHRRGGDDAGDTDDGASADSESASVRRTGFRARVAATSAGLRRLAGRQAIVAVMILRNLPVAPFGVINVACGVAGIPWRAYLVGTGLGMLPGILVLGIIGRSITDVIADPRPLHIGILLGGIVALGVLMWLASRIGGRLASGSTPPAEAGDVGPAADAGEPA